MTFLVFAIALLVCFAGVTSTSVKSSPCDTCVNDYHDGIPVSFCGTDLKEYSSYSSAFDSYCFDQCGVMVYTAYSCSCPNDCGSDIGHGTCSGPSGSCVCKAGWSGPDCSQIAPGNKCNYHGKFVSGSSTDSYFPFDQCVCDDGFTGIDCSSTTLKSSAVPWGTLFDTDSFTSKDTYKDAHPVWNTSVLATIHIEIDVDDYIFILQPWNLYNETYANATIHFDNGNIRSSYSNVGFRVKGMSSRMVQKKGWTVKFNEFVKGQKLLDISKFGLKPGSTNDDTLLKTMLYTDFNRAMGVPVQRASFALLYINNIYSGVYFMHEEIDPTFVDVRIPDDDGSGNMMKLFYNVNLQYFGSDVDYYKNEVHVNRLGVPMHYYEQSDGNGDWTDFIDFLYFFNSTNDVDFANLVEERIDVNSLLKQMVVESFMLATDNLESGQNYYVYHLQSSSTPNKWQLIYFDFDECFSWNFATGESEMSLDILQYYLRIKSDYEDNNPLFYRLLAVPKYTSQFLNYYKTFLNGVFGSSSAQLPTDRYADYLQFIAPWVAQDMLWQMSFGVPYEEFLSDAYLTISNLEARYVDTYSQVMAYSSQKK